MESSAEIIDQLLAPWQEEEKTSKGREEGDGASPSTTLPTTTEDGCPEYLRRTIACLPLLVKKLANLELLISRLLSTGRNAEDYLSVKHCCQLELTLKSLEEAMMITTSIVRRMGLSSSVLEPLVDRIEPMTALIVHSTRLVRFHVAWPSEKTFYLLSTETLMQEMRTSSMRALSKSLKRLRGRSKALLWLLGNSATLS